MKRPEGFDPAPDSRVSSNADQVRAASARAERGSRALLASAVGRRATVRVGSRLGAGVSTMESAAAVRDRGPNPEKAARKILRQKTRERRRFEKSEVRRFTRRSRHRRAALATTGGVIVVMATLLVIAVYSPLLALKQINIVGASRLDSTRILDVVDGQLHTPLALVDFDRITRELGTFPLIRSYVTEIVPPDTLTIRLVERAPIGAIAVVDGYEIVDPAGVVIEKSGARLPKIPLIDIGGQKPDSAAFRAAVEVLLALPPTVAAELDTVTASSTDNVNLSLAGGGAKILWGSADRSAYKARVLSAVLAKNYPNVTEYNVSAPGQLTYR